ncbi:amino acid adenylation domain-containing protein [Peribacillus phoenicis]|uniref:amino acid adenylation domain-containing protein n=1 Tax=Peribacillus sp. 1P06PA-2 TaxID=3132295 RepID=UPI0039A6C04B
MHKEDFLQLSQDQKRQYLLEMREKLSINTQSSYKDIKKLKYPRLRKNDNDRFNCFPLTDIQESFLIGKFYGMSQDTIGCHIYCEFEKKDLNVQKLKQSWMELVHHHEMLHTIINSSGEQSILHEVPAFDMPVHDLRMVDNDTIETHKQKVRNELSHKLYEAGQWPLFDLQFSLLPDENVLIHLSIDEWIVDAASVDLLLDQWYQLYHDSSYELPDLDVSFRDMVMAWKEFEQSDVFKRDLNYWMNKLEAAPGGPSLPQGKPQLKKGFSYVPRYRLTGELEEEKWKKIKQKARELEVSPTVLLLTLFSQVLEEYSDLPSFSLIQTYFNRLPLHPKLDQVVGPFISTNIFVADQRYKDWKQQAQANQKQVWEDLDHSSVSGIRAMRDLRAKHKDKSIPNFPVVFTSMLNNVGKVGQGRPSWFHYMTYNITQTPQVYLDHQISERNGVLHFNWDVAEGYLPRPLVEEMFGRYERRLREIILEDQMVVSSTTSSSFGLTDLQQTYVVGRLQGENKQSCQMYQEFQVRQLDVSRLQQALQQLIEHHGMLRAIVHDDGTQEILTQVPAYKIPVNLAQNAHQLDAHILQVRKELQNQVFPLGKWPLFDLRVTQGVELSYVHLCTDALIADGASLFLLYQQLIALYENPETKLSPLEVSYRDYCQYINEQRQSAEGQKARAYWEEKMATIVPGPIPSLTSESSRSTMQGVISDWRALKEKAARWGVKPGTVLLTAFQEVLATHFDHAFTTVVVNWDRPFIHKQVNELIGDFTSLSYIESLPTEQSFLHRARVNQKELEEDLSHHLVSGMHGLRKRAMGRKDEGYLSFPIVFTNLVEDQEISLPSGWEMGYSSSKTPGIYLDMIPVEKNGVLHFHWDMMEGLFSPAVKQTLFTHFSERLAELASDEENWKEKPLRRHSDTFSTIHEWFERQVELYPQNLALKWNHEVMTYQTLNERSNQLARYLQSRGVGPEVMVGICVERSLDMMVGILGILKAGGAYVPLDPAHPKDRLAYILEDSDVSLVITQETVLSSLKETKAALICLDRDQHFWSSKAVTNFHVPVATDGLAYVIYTSGSTGRPKGVLVTHQNVIRLMHETEEWYDFNERDTWTLYHSYAFDFSVWEIWGALLYGGKLIIVPYKTTRTFESFYELLVQERVTVLNQTPTAFRQLMRVDEQNERSTSLALRYVIFGGEALDPRMLQGWFDRHGHQKPQLVNMYGITETTVHVTYRPITKKDIYSSNSIIGTPIRDLQVYILDEHLQTVPRGTVGEMYVGGLGVARGYLNQDQLTKERFIPSPFHPMERLYKTGDLAHYMESGELAFVGRNDNQVKVRGFRIELGEIEAALKTNELIEDAVVTVKDDLDDQQIIAYIVGDYSASTPSIRQYLRNLLPIYMIPNLIIPITEIPLTVNGKLDYKKLPEVIVDKRMDNQPSDLEDKSVINSFIEVMKRDVKLSDNLFDLGITSITIVKIAQAIQGNCGVSVPVEVFLESKDINEIIRYVHNNQTVVLTEPSSDISYTQYLIQIIEEITCTRITDENDDIFNLGVTSLTIMKLSQRFKEEKGIHLPVEAFLENPTITGISTYITQNTSVHPENNQLDIGNQGQASIIELENIEFQDRHYISRRNLLHDGESHSFSIDKLSELMSLLRIKNLEGQDRYLYPSAGGKYAVQTYVLIKDRIVEELEPGIYYYHPEKHGLVLIQRIKGIEKDIFAKNDQITFENSNVCLFFIAQLEAFIPFYGEEFSKGLAILDGGYINQLLLSRMPSLDLNAKVINAMNFTRIRNLFQLDDNHMYIHSICISTPVKNKSEDKHNVSDMQDSLRNYLLSKQHEVVPVADMSKTIKYTMNDPQTLEELMEKRIHIRRVKTREDIFLLKEIPINETDYYVRASQRTYDKSLITFYNFSKFLSLIKPNTSFKNQYLSYNLLPAGSIKFYLYIKKGVISGIDEGLYRYDPLNHKLLLIRQELSFDMEYTHSPFNRKHYRNSGFCLFATTDVNEVAYLYGDYAKQLALFEVGNIGQLLMDRQAEFDIGLVPIGGHNFDKVRADFSLADNEILLHSFLGGSLKHSHSRNKEDLLSLKDSSQVDSTKKQEEVLNIKEGSGEQRPVLEDIAIIGLSGQYPDAINMDEYWRNLRSGKHSITHLPKERSKLYNLQVTSDGYRKDQWAGYIQDIDQFDSMLFNITPSEARNMDPQERLALQTVWECFEDAGYTADSLKNKAPEIGVFVGAMWNDYQNYGESEWEKNQQAKVAAIHSSIANRISHYFGLIGPSISINTSCASSLTAIHLAYESVKRGECDAAIIVGVNLISHPYHYDSLLQQGLLSTNDRSAAFSAEGTGLVPGEGIGAVLIKHVKEAVDHKDHIYGVIKGSVINHYGEASRYGSPNKKMQVNSIQRLLNKTATPIDAIDYIECAATGSSMADASELNAIKEVFTNKHLKVGSVKPNIGHLESASAMSQLSKVLLQFKHGEIAPTIHTKPVNPFLMLEDGQIEIIDQLTSWKTSKPKHTIISSYGAMGSIGHLLIKEYRKNHADTVPSSRSEVCLFSAESKDQMKRYAERFISFLDHSEKDENLQDIAFTLHVGRREMKERMAIIAEDIADLKNKLEAYVSHHNNIKNVYVGTVDGSTERGLWNKDNYVVEDIASSWIKGSKVNIEKFFEDGYRLSLPTYPFEQVSHWYQKETILPPKVAEKSVFDHGEIKESNLPPEGGDGDEKLQYYLLEAFSEITEIPLDRLNKRTSFESYGINSLLITRLNEKLEVDMGITSKTLFFENQNIEELANSINRTYHQKVSENEKPSDRKKDSKEQKSSSSVGENLNDQISNYSDSDLAIIGVSGKYAQADNHMEFWENLKLGKDCITEIPKERWNNDYYFNEDKRIKGTVYGKWGGFIKDVKKFDSLFFNISPKEAERTDPQERLFLQTTWECIEDAGYTRNSLQRKHQGNIGVFVGAMYQEYPLYGYLDKYSNSENVALGSSAGSIANRISYFFNFHGPSLAIDTMCSSALTSLHYAAQSIKQNECEVAVVGGVNLLLHPNKYLMHSQMKMLSSDGRCRSFGKGGDGFVPGEGIGSVLIKPLKKAIQDGDNIYAVIKGTAINNDGKTNGYTVPNPKQQEDVIKRALEKAQINPRTITYLEAHGTGTELGDPIEITGLTNAYRTYTQDKQYCAIGSVKSNIGHCESAAGIAGLTKVVLQLKNKQLLPSIHADELNPNINFEETPFVLQREFEDWKQPKAVIDGVEQQFPRRAGISSFGAGGVNAHVILEEYIPIEQKQTKAEEEQQEQLILLSASNDKELKQYALNLLSVLGKPLERASKVKEKEIIQCVAGCLSTLIDVEVNSLDINEEVGQVLDPLSYKELEEQLKRLYGENIEIPSILEEISITSIAKSIMESMQLSPSENEGITCSQRLSFRLKDISHTLKVGREPMHHRLALIVANTDELVHQLSTYLQEPSKVNRSSSIMIGIQPDKVDSIWEESELKRVIANWIKDNKLRKLADLWVKGVDIEWPDSLEGYCRVTLPTYPFKGQIHWPSISEDVREERASKPVGKYKTFEEPLSKNKNSLGLTKESPQIEHNVKECIEIISKVIKLPKENLDLSKSFSDYGVDSIAITEISEEIKERIAPDISAVDFFEATTIDEFLNSLPLEKASPQAVNQEVTTIDREVIEEEDRKNQAYNVKQFKNDQRIDTPVNEPIAIIGMNGKLPGADTINEFWESIRQGESHISLIPKERWDWEQYYGDPLKDGDYTDVKYGGFIKDIDKFDSNFFGISPKEATLMDPQQRLFLETTWKTIEDAGYKPSDINGSRTGVFVGVSNKDYEHFLAEHNVSVEAHLATGNSHAILANRISYFYNLRGPSEAVDTACSSSIVAIHRAIKAIQSNECDMALAGGVNILLSPKNFIAYRKAGMLSPTNIVKTFNEDADGYIRGEGVGAILLKPLSMAKEDGDHIYAVIRGSSVNHNGKGFALTVPSASAQADVIKDAWHKAGINPSTISYIEAQGTGTKMGDAIEIRAIKKAFEDISSSPQKKCGIGSVKPNIGHLEAASGMASLFKVIKSFENKIIPMTANVTELNKEIDLVDTPFYIVDKTISWDQKNSNNDEQLPRRASIHSFGVGGTNAHLVIEEYVHDDVKVESANNKEPFLFLCSAKTEDQLLSYVHQIKEHVNQDEKINFEDFIYTLHVGREYMEERIAMIVKGREDFLHKCNEFLRLPNTVSSYIYRSSLGKSVNSLNSSETITVSPETKSHNDLMDLADAWINFAHINWKEFYKVRGVKRVPVPTYPFKKVKRWIELPAITNKLKDEDKVQEVKVVSIEKQVGNKQNDTPNVSSKIAVAVADLLGYETEEIPLDVSLIVIGMDSVTVMKLQYILERDLNLSIPLTMLNNNLSINEICNNILELKNHQNPLDIENLTSEQLDDLFLRIKS